MSTHALPVHVALVDDTASIDAGELAQVAGALNEQVQSDFAPVWHVRATVGVYPASQLPPHTWAIHIQRQLSEPGALGYHTDDYVQPVSYVELTDSWPQTCSHELLEMLADPWGSRMHAARLPQGLEHAYEHLGLKHESSRVSYLLEVCDPPEEQPHEVGGVPLSDFLLPGWYRTTPTPLGYSRYGNCSQPREVPDGGYVSFANPAGEWYQAFGQNGALQVQDLGRFDKAEFSSLREWADSRARATLAELRS